MDKLNHKIDSYARSNAQESLCGLNKFRHRDILLNVTFFIENQTKIQVVAIDKLVGGITMIDASKSIRYIIFSYGTNYNGIVHTLI